MRHEYNMDKGWRFCPSDAGVTVGTTHSAAYSAVKSGGVSGIAGSAYNDMDWEIVDLPHDYVLSAPFDPDEMLSHGYKKRGNAWYRKTFRLPESARGKHIFLLFEGIAVNAEVYLNGSLVGRSFSAYTPLDIDITDRAHFGETLNTIAVFTDGTAVEGWWYEGAGIYRHVRLYVKEPLHIAHDGLWWKPVLMMEDIDAWSVTAEARLENSAYTPAVCQIEATLYDGDKLIAQSVVCPITVGGDATAEHSATLHVVAPHRWDIDDPYRYRAVMSLYGEDGTLLDRDETKIGFRTFRIVGGKGAFLNGRKIWMNGTCNHQDHACVGVAVPDEIQKYRIRRLKDMGCNAYRAAHNLPAKEILDACDEYGMLVMDENRRLEARPEVLAQVEKMVRRDRNHPSVVMWSLFNEEPLQGDEEGARIFRRMKALVKRLDDTRIVTGAMHGGYLEKDGIAPETDATGINYAINEDWPLCERYHELYPDRPVYGSENNSMVSVRGCYQNDDAAHMLACYDEEKMSWGATVRRMWRFRKENPWCGGHFVWTGFDYRGEPSPYDFPTVTSLFGVMDLCGFPKDGYYQTQVCFRQDPLVHLQPHWNWQVGEKVRVMVSSNCDEVELRLNGETILRAATDPGHPIDTAVTFTPGVIEAIGYRDGKAVASDKRVTAGAPYRIVAEPDRTTLFDDGEDATLVNYHVVDKDGNVVDTADCLLTFTVTGDGKLLGVGNGDPNSLASETAPERKLFAGYAQAAVTAGIGAETLSIRAESEGLIPAETTFTIEKTKESEKPDYITLVDEWYLPHISCTCDEEPTKPDLFRKVDDNDMNTMSKITFNNYDYLPWTTSGWRFLRAVFRSPEAFSDTFHGKGALIFRDVAGYDIEIAVNGKVLFTGEQFGGQLRIDFDCTAGEDIELRMIYRAGEKVPRAGIKYGVMYAFM